MLVGKQNLHECMPASSAGICLASAGRMQHIDNRFGCVSPTDVRHNLKLKKHHTLKLGSTPKAENCHSKKMGGLLLSYSKGEQPQQAEIWLGMFR